MTEQNKNRIGRRRFIKGMGATAAVVTGGMLAGSPLLSALTAPLHPSLSGYVPNPDPWSELPAILARIKPPSFPNRDFDVTKFGAIGDNKTDCTAAFERAIAACHAAKGGRVVLPAGEFVTGAIRLKSNVNLYIGSDATIRFTRDTRKYPLVFTRWEGIELMNYSPFIYAFEEENIAVTGEGVIDGNADCEHWWPWKGRTRCGWKEGEPNQFADRAALFAMAEKRTPVSERVFGEGHYLRPQFIQPYRCKNVLLEGVTLKNSPMWQVHPVLCSNVTVRRMTITGADLNRDSAPNTDGCDPESCTDVLIEGCNFNTGDDCIAIKAGRNEDGRRVNARSENIVIRGCHMRDGHGGVTVGSEISGGVRNVFAENCRMDSPRLDNAVRIKNNAMRGGLLENIHVRNIEVGEVGQAALSIDFFYEEGEAGKFTPVVRNVDIRNVNVKKAQYALYLRGFKNAPIGDVQLIDCNLDGVEKPNVVENVNGLQLSNVHINGKLVNDRAAGQLERPDPLPLRG
ncbi:MAG TPA: glycoside hydrolase family 28 protein [Candidatus Angelobacter sp.]|nr:glycoside hydrolase family 28 protein [Candidatus Angelobacter sp.]